MAGSKIASTPSRYLVVPSTVASRRAASELGASPTIVVKVSVRVVATQDASWPQGREWSTLVPHSSNHQRLIHIRGLDSKVWVCQGVDFIMGPEPYGPTHIMNRLINDK